MDLASAHRAVKCTVLASEVPPADSGPSPSPGALAPRDPGLAAPAGEVGPRGEPDAVTAARVPLPLTFRSPLGSRCVECVGVGQVSRAAGALALKEHRISGSTSRFRRDSKSLNT